jgi:hypothetical protein
MARSKKIYGHLATSKLNQIAGYDCTLNPAARRVLTVLTGYANQEGHCWPSVVTISKCLGVSRAAVSKQIDALIERGYLSKKARYHKGGGKKSNVYLLNYDLANQYYKEPDIFSEPNILKMLAIFAATASCIGMEVDEVTYHVTQLGNIKIKNDNKTIKIGGLSSNALRYDYVAASKAANDFDMENERLASMDISKDEVRIFDRIYEDLKMKIGAKAVVAFDTTLNKSAKAMQMSNKAKLDYKISEFSKELNRIILSE